MRILVAGAGAPWAGTRVGARIREEHVLRGLARSGRVTFVSFDEGDEGDAAPPPDCVERLIALGAPTRYVRSKSQWLLRTRRRIPYHAVRHGTLDEQQASRLRALAAEHDLTFMLSSTSAAIAFPHLPPGTEAGIDLYDLEGDIHRQTASALRSEPGLKSRAKRVFESAEARSWDRFERRLARHVNLTTVCKREDVQTLGLPSVRYVPNGCSIPEFVGAPELAPPPTITFHGLMRYQPNRDGATWFVEAVLPLLRREHPDVLVRIVGEAPPAIVALGADSNVIITGYVDDLEAELRGSHLVVVPLRLGTGTRLKILEAFAWQVPVVSTSRGCEGLSVTDGRELIVADSPQRFAKAIGTLLTDQALRQAMVRRAYEYASANHNWNDIEESIARYAREAVRGSR